MKLIPEREAAKLKVHLAARLTAPVTLHYFTAPESGPAGEWCETCEATGQLLAEVAALSDKLRLEVHAMDDEGPARELGVDRVPTLVLRGAARGTLRWVGIPSGYEFPSLLEDLVDVARGETDLSAETKQALDGLARDVLIRVFVTPGCPFCPGVARLAHQMAVESPRVTAEVVEAAEFPDLVERYRVQGVPKVVVNDSVEFVGAKREAAFLGEVLRAAGR